MPRASLLGFYLVAQAFAKTFGHLVFDTISYQFHDVLGPIEDGRAVGADFEMRFHTGAHLRVNISVQVIGDLSPDLEAAYLNHLHWIQMVPFSFRRLGQSGITTAAPFRILACRSSSSRQYPAPGHPAFGGVPGEAWSLHCLL
jgi:hypothetical protein